MSPDFYDRTGRPYAYSDDGGTIYTFSGTPVAYIEGDSVYGFNGRHLGFFESGSVYDKFGDTLLFSADSGWVPIKPVRQSKPVKSIKQMPAVKAMKRAKPMKPMFGVDWSRHSPEQVFEGTQLLRR